MLAGIAWSEVGGQPDIGDNLALAASRLGLRKTPGNKTSTGDVSIQLRHVAKMEGLDPDHLTWKQENEIFRKLQDENYNLEVVARHIAEMRDKVYPDKKGQSLDNEQIKRLGYMYNMEAGHPAVQRDKDLTNAKDIPYAGRNTSSYGYDLIKKLEKMKGLLKE